MKRISRPSLVLPNLPRRRFIQGLAAGGVLLGLSPWVRTALARETSGTAIGSAKVLTGTEFDLTIAETPVNFTGTPRMATTVNGSIPAPTLRWREGDTVTLRVHQPARRGHLHSLARHPPAVPDGRRAGHQLQRHPARRNLHLSLQGPADRYLLVSLAFRHAGADRHVRRHHHRPGRWRSDPRRSRLRGAVVRLDRRRSDAGIPQAQDAERLLQLQPADGGGFLPRCVERRAKVSPRQAQDVERRCA